MALLSIRSNCGLWRVGIFQLQRTNDNKSDYSRVDTCSKGLFEHINADIENEEPFAYAVGFIAECCDEVKKRKFKK